MSLKNNTTGLTISQLNNSYIKLIKMFLNGDYSSSTPHINSFYYDLSPNDAYSLLNKIFQQSHSNKQEIFTSTNQTFSKKFGLKRALTSMPSQSSGYTSNFNFDLQRDIKFSPTRNPRPQELNLISNQQQKNQKLRRITSCITEVFSSNNKKIQKYEEVSKYQSASNSANKNSITAIHGYHSRNTDLHVNMFSDSESRNY